MTPFAGRTARALGGSTRPDARPRMPAAAVGVAVAVLALVLGLTSCGGSAQAGPPGGDTGVASWTQADAGARAVDRQADAQLAAADAAARAGAAAAAEGAPADQAAGAGHQSTTNGRSAADGESGQCTMRPEDRAACTLPEGTEIDPNGGDVDGDGVFEKHEPVGPGYKDPRAYDGGQTSGEAQCAWARQQGHGC